MELMRPYLGQYRNVTTDNWFMSLPLAKALLEEKTTAVGTLRKKPYVPEKMTELKKERPINTTAFLYSDQIMLLSFKPKANKTVMLLTSKHHKMERLRWCTSTTALKGALTHLIRCVSGTLVVERLNVGLCAYIMG